MKIYEKGKNQGITLIALVVTIVVLLILAGITINMLFSENGIITKAKEAAEKTAKAEEDEAIGMQNVVSDIDKLVSGGTTGPVTNPYDPDGWIMAWTVNNGTWSSAITAGNTAEGDIVAKLYLTGNKITPPSLTYSGVPLTFTEGDEYALVIEGNGEMPEVIDSNFVGYAWHESTIEYVEGTSEEIIVPYITEILVSEGIESVGTYAFAASSGLEKITLGNGIKKIESGSFVCSGITNITIPESVTYIASQAFIECNNLEEVHILTTNSDEFEIGQFIFDGLKQDSIIYVADKKIKSKIDNGLAYDMLITQVELIEDSDSSEKKVYEGNLVISQTGTTQITGLTEEINPTRNYRINFTINGKEKSYDMRTYLWAKPCAFLIGYTKIDENIVPIIIRMKEDKFILELNVEAIGDNAEIIINSIYDIGEAGNYLEENGFGVFYSESQKIWGLANTPNTEYIVPQTVAGKTVSCVWLDSINGIPTFTTPVEVTVWDVDPNVSSIKITTSDVEFYFNATHIDSWFCDINVDLSECEGDVTIPEEFLEKVYRGTIYVTPEVKAKYEDYENIVAKE